MNEKYLVEACLNGNTEAQELLYNNYKALMMGLCLRYAKSREEAQDILQEGFIKVFRDLHQYRATSPLGAWIRRVMINTALENIRKHKKERELKQSLPLENLANFHFSDANNEQHDADYLVRLIQQLPTDYQLVFNLFAVEGYSHKEIAETLNINIGTSKVRLLRARAQLQQKLALLEESMKVNKN